MPRPASIPSRYLTVLALLSMLGTAGSQQLRLGEHGFDWSTVEQDRAHFRWSAEIINETSETFDVKVTLDLLDDDDAVVHSDSTTTTLRAAQTRTVRHDGSLPFARAADVVSLRFRIDPSPPQRR